MRSIKGTVASIITEDTAPESKPNVRTLDGLGSSVDAQFVEQAAGMGLDGVFADKEFFGDLAIAQAVGNQLEDLQLASGNPELGQSLLVQSKELRRRHFSNNDCLFMFCEFESKPDAQDSEEQGD
jgi:hypothetical protein